MVLHDFFVELILTKLVDLSLTHDGMIARRVSFVFIWKLFLQVTKVLLPNTYA